MNLFLIAACLILLSGFTRKHTPAFQHINIADCTDTLPPKEIFEAVESEAYFPGGEAGWRQYLEQNLNPEVPVVNGAPAGKYTIMVQFIVDTDGKLSEFKALTHYGYGMEPEVLRILKKSPPWIPAVQKQHNVKAYRKQPVTFMVIDDRKKRKHRS